MIFYTKMNLKWLKQVSFFDAKFFLIIKCVLEKYLAKIYSPVKKGSLTSFLPSSFSQVK